MKLLLKENGLVLYHPGSRKKDSGCKPNLGLRKSFHFSPELKGDLVCIQSIETWKFSVWSFRYSGPIAKQAMGQDKKL